MKYIAQTILKLTENKEKNFFEQAEAKRVESGCLIASQKTIYYDGKSRTIQRVAYAIYNNIPISSIPNYKWIRPICGNSKCIAKEHLLLEKAGRKKLKKEEKEKQELEKIEASLIKEFGIKND